MRRSPSSPLILLLALCAATFFAVACGDSDDGEGEPSTGTSSTTSATSNTTGSTSSTGTSSSSTTPARETDFTISYVSRNRSQIPGIEPGGQLMLLASDGSAETQVNPESVECNVGCAISGDLQWFVWISADGSQVLRAAPITALGYDGVSVDMNDVVEVATNVLSYQVGGGSISYMTLDFEVFAGILPGDGAKSVGSVGVDGINGGFYMKPDGTEVITWTVTLSEMTLSRFDLDSVNSMSAFYTFSSPGFGGTGSFYGSRERMAWSPDGRYLAVATRGLLDTTPCEQGGNSCLATETCGETARCTSQRLIVNMIDFENLDKLNTPCLSDSECGEAHVCDFADPADPNSGTCFPGRLNLGPTGPQDCTSRQDGDFTDMGDNLVWGPDSNSLFMLAIEDCARFNIPRVAILRTDATLKTPEAVIENPGQDWSAQNCYDDDEEEFTPGDPNCVVDISEFQISPDGNTVIFAGSSTGAKDNYELYSIDARGQREKRLFTNNLEQIVESVGSLDEL